MVNSLFGASVTTAGLLPGTAIAAGARERAAISISRCFPAKPINDDGLFMDSMSFDLLAAGVPMELRLSKDFIDALHDPVAA